MISKRPKTYNEIMRLKKCYTLTRYYSNITENMFNEIYDFLSESTENLIVANRTILVFFDGNGKSIKKYSMNSQDDSFDIIKISDKGISIIPHYDSE